MQDQHLKDESPYSDPGCTEELLLEQMNNQGIKMIPRDLLAYVNYLCAHHVPTYEKSFFPHADILFPWVKESLALLTEEYGKMFLE